MSESDFPVLREQMPYLIAKDSIQLAPASDTPFAALRVAHERWGPQRIIRRRAFPYCLIGLALAGRAQLRTATATYRLAPGMVFSFHTGHDLVLQITKALEVRIAVGWGVELRSQADEQLGTQPASWMADDPVAFERILLGLHEAARAGGPFVQPVCDDYYRILLRTAHLGRLRANVPVHGALATFARAKEIIDRDPLQCPSVAELAQRMRIDRSHLSRLFVRFCGCGPSAYAARHRLAQAAELLASGSSVAATASRCGYADAFSFSKAFSRHYGVPPSHWIRR